jgi:hypothetical protein
VRLQEPRAQSCKAIRPFLLLQSPVGAAGPVVLPAADHADLPHPVPGPGRPVGSEAVLTVERLRARAGIGDPPGSRARRDHVKASAAVQAEPGQADRAGPDEAAVARLVYRTCRNEHFIREQIYTPPSIFTHGSLALIRDRSAAFPVSWQEVRSLTMRCG